MTAATLMPDILLLNANTDHDMTDRMVVQARRLHSQCRGATVTQGANYISDEASMQVAARSVTLFVEGLKAAQQPDALIVACFGDPAVRDLRARFRFPVVGLAEASCVAAFRSAGRFGIVTGGSKWPPLLHDLVSEIGLASWLSGIYALDQTGDQIARDRGNARAAIRSAVAQAEADGAEAVILGGAGLIGFAKELEPSVGVPLLDSVDCAVKRAVALVN
ncbi:MAG: Asp/Glu racemase [Spiribacter salinus]|uniref:Asp/Glu racemase n=1 Tax=Spiribacter salinus TaxID=1335746 RepID=A0A540VRB3_9GAMM|nr:MAG: Asp/Glu racemase [Spiribacter salinus]